MPTQVFLSHRDRFRMVALAIIVVSLVVVVIFGTWKAFRDGSNRIEDWLPSGAQETRELDWFRTQFGNDSFLMVSWDGCQLDSSASSKTAQFAECLRRATDDSHSASLFSQVITSDEAIGLLTDRRIGLNLEESLRRLKGWMIGVDDKQSCLVAVLSSEGAGQDRAAVDSIYKTAAEIFGPEFDSDRQLHIAGPAVESLEIEKSSHQFLVPLNLACYTVCSLLLFATFRCRRLTAIVLLNAIASQLFLLASIGYSPWCRLDAILLIAPSFMFVITVSGAIHMVNYYRDQARQDSSESIVRRSLRSAAAPTLLAAVTTCIGLMSLSLSSLAPVRNFGVYSALGVLLSLVLLSSIPWQIKTCVPRDRLTRFTKEGQTRRRSQRLARFTEHWHWKILTLSGLVLGLGLWGVSHIQAKIRMHDFFLPQSKLNRDYEWLQQRIGPLGPIEIVAQIPRDPGLSFLRQAELIEQVVDHVRGIDGVFSIASGVTFTPPLNSLKPASLRGIAKQTLLKQRVEEIQEGLIEAGFLRVLPEESLWRITVRTFSNDRVDYGPLCASLRSKLAQVSADIHTGGGPHVPFVITGGVPVLQRAQDLMLEDLVKSFLWALLLITCSQIILLNFWAFRASPHFGLQQSNAKAGVLRRVRTLILTVFGRTLAGCLSMVPNVLPVVIVFGVIGALGIEVGIGSMLTASVAMGVSVDDTLHFLTWHRRGIVSGRSRFASVESTLEHCSTAMIQTTAVFVLGLAVFTLSPSLPTARYAGIICSMLSIALVSDLLVLPAILLSSLGRLFGGESPSHEASNTPGPEISP